MSRPVPHRHLPLVHQNILYLNHLVRGFASERFPENLATLGRDVKVYLKISWNHNTNGLIIFFNYLFNGFGGRTFLWAKGGGKGERWQAKTRKVLKRTINQIYMAKRMTTTKTTKVCRSWSPLHGKVLAKLEITKHKHTHTES